MSEEKTLLQQIREKEKEVNVHLEQVVSETDGALAQTKKEAEKILLQGECTGKELAENRLAQDRENLQKEIIRMKKNADDQVESIKKTGTANLPRVVDQIVRYVVMD